MQFVSLSIDQTQLVSAVYVFKRVEFAPRLLLSARPLCDTLTATPSVLEMMSSKLGWMQKLGDCINFHLSSAIALI